MVNNLLKYAFEKNIFLKHLQLPEKVKTEIMNCCQKCYLRHFGNPNLNENPRKLQAKLLEEM